MSEQDGRFTARKETAMTILALIFLASALAFTAVDFASA